MKKIILLGFSILGISHFAGAWMAKSPQTWRQSGSNGQTLVVTCHNVENVPCMSGEGSGPVKGQECKIYDVSGNVIATGVIQKAIANPDLPDANDPPIGTPTVLEIQVSSCD